MNLSRQYVKRGANCRKWILRRINHASEGRTLIGMSDEGREQKYIKEAFDTNWVVPLGPNVNAFEKDLENFVGAGRKVVALSAGTAAIHLALIACGVQAGDGSIVAGKGDC